VPGDAPPRADGAVRAARTALRAVVAILVTTACLAGCGPVRDGGAGSPAATAAVEVPWADYGPGVRNRIDSWAASGECDRLRDTRATAVADGDAVRRRTGHGNEALIAYLDAVSRVAGCPDRS